MYACLNSMACGYLCTSHCYMCSLNTFLFRAVLLTLLYNHTVTQQPASKTPLVANSSQCSITPQMDGCYKMVKDFSKNVHKVGYKHSKFQLKLLMTDLLITDKTLTNNCRRVYILRL